MNPRDYIYQDVYVVLRNLSANGSSSTFYRPGIIMGWDEGYGGFDVNVWLHDSGDATTVGAGITDACAEVGNQQGLLLALRAVNPERLCLRLPGEKPSAWRTLQGRLLADAS